MSAFSTLRTAWTFSFPSFFRTLWDQCQWRDWQPRPLFPTLPPSLASFNQHAAEILLARLGIAILPEHFARQLRTTDVRYAFDQFLKQVGISYRELMFNAQKREAQIVRLRDAVALILRVEKIASSATVTPEPIFAALAWSLSSAEALCDRYAVVVDLWETVAPSATVFPLHQRFKDALHSQIMDWPRLSAGALAEARDINQDYLRLQVEFTTLKADLDAALTRLRPLAETDEELQHILQQIAERREALEAAIYSGLIDPVEGIASLHDLLNDCEAVAVDVEDPRERYCRILGIPLTATKASIRKAYRRFAKKYHPDHNPSSDAAAKFHDIQEAYEALMRMA